MTAESKPLDRAAAIEAFLADKRAAVAAPAPANDTAPRPTPVEGEKRVTRAATDLTEDEARFIEDLRADLGANRSALARKYGVSRGRLHVLIDAHGVPNRVPTGRRPPPPKAPKPVEAPILEVPYVPAPPPPTVAGRCPCGRRAVFARPYCAGCRPSGPGLIIKPKPAGQPPRPSREDEDDVDADGAPLHHPLTRRVPPPVVDLEKEKTRAAERARLLAVLPAEKITRIAAAPDLFRAAIERTQRFAAERFEAEAKAAAAKRAKRHSQYQLERVRSRRQEALDRRDRIGEFALDGAASYAEDPAEAFRKAMIASGGAERTAWQFELRISERRGREILAKLIAEGLIPARRLRGPASKEITDGDNKNAGNESPP